MGQAIVVCGASAATRLQDAWRAFGRAVEHKMVRDRAEVISQTTVDVEAVRVFDEFVRKFCLELNLNPDGTEPRMDAILIPRDRYDSLVERCPQFMAEEWERFSRQWCVSGVLVTTDDLWLVKRLRSILNGMD